MTPEFVRFTCICISIYFTVIPSSYSLNMIRKSSSEEPRIKQFRALVQPLIYPNNSHVHKYISDNLYIHQWLERSNFNVEKARIEFMDHLAWRKLEKIDEIHLENWSYYQSEYPQFGDTVDKMGRPVTEVWLADWNIRGAVLSGRGQRLIRWLTYIMEMALRRLYELRQERGRRNVSNAVELIDMDGFNMWEHGCMSCVPVYLSWGQIWEKHYRYLWESIYMINVGPVFRSFLSMGNAFNHASKDVTKMYFGKREWMPVLGKEISEDERSSRFGGHLDRSTTT